MTTDRETPTANEVFDRLAARFMADPSVRISIPAHAVRDWERYADDALEFVRSSAQNQRGS